MINPMYHNITRLNDDKCLISLRDFQSSQPAELILNTPGYSTFSHSSYLNNLSHYPTNYLPTQDLIDLDTQLKNSVLTNQRNLNQLYTRPYKGSYRGAGQGPDHSLIDVESRLLDSQQSKVFKSVNMPGITINRFDYLPSDPQQLNKVISPFPRFGLPSRDLVRQQAILSRQHYEMGCNKLN
jgi:hypothetical protein